MRNGCSHVFHLDAPAWFNEAERPHHLRAIADAVWSQKRIQMRYRSWKTEKTRSLNPLGLVLKGGAWYMAGDVDGSIRTYRIGRIIDVIVLDERFERPTDFDLAAYWTENTQRLEVELHPNRATVRLSDLGAKMLAASSAAYARSRTEISETADKDGWRTATLPVGSINQAAYEFLHLGSEIEVMEPPELRARMVEIIDSLRERYR